MIAHSSGADSEEAPSRPPRPTRRVPVADRRLPAHSATCAKEGTAIRPPTTAVGQVGVRAREVNRQGFVVDDDGIRQVASGGVLGAGVRAVDRAEQSRRVRAQRDGSFQAATDVRM